LACFRETGYITLHCLLYIITAVPDAYGIVRVYRHHDVKLPCHVTPTATANVTWLQKEKPTSLRLWDIYINGQIFRNLRDRFSIQDAAAGDYSLTILTTTTEDAGRYRCFNQQQLLQNYVVYVAG